MVTRDKGRLGSGQSGGGEDPSALDLRVDTPDTTSLSPKPFRGKTMEMVCV